MLHCAASISFDLPLDEARAINVEGTRAGARLRARGAGARRLERFVHVSTAYVAGTPRGRVPRAPARRRPAFRNTYEQTKAEAEQIVADAGDLAAGDRAAEHRRGRARHRLDAGVQRPLLAAAGLRARAVRGDAGAPDGRVDIVPVDYVADALVHLLDRREAGVFNLVAGRNAATVDELATLASEYFDRPRAAVRRARSTDRLRRPRARRRLRPVLRHATSSSTTPAPARVLVPAGIEAPPLRDYFPKLMDYAQAVRWGKQKMTREAARARRAELAAT